MRALITGITGQDGAYLANFLHSRGYQVHGVVRSHAPNLQNINFFNLAGAITWHLGDVGSPEDMSRVIAMGFDEVYNLAAQSFVGSSWDQPHTTAQTNAMGPLNILEAIRRHAPRTRFYQASTSEMFGNAPAPQNEESSMIPRSPYGAAKLFGHAITRNYRESFGIHASSGILFNHESPLRGPQFVTRKITMGIARVVREGGPPIVLGNLAARRDWGFAGDYVRAMWLMLQQPRGDDYVVATGESHSIEEFLDAAWGEASREVGIPMDWRGHIMVDPRLHRPAEVHHLLGDCTKIRQLGWEPEVTFSQLVRKMMLWDLKGAR
jgi:GDPmannose 4,6-dehydratase